MDRTKKIKMTIYIPLLIIFLSLLELGYIDSAKQEVGTVTSETIRVTASETGPASCTYIIVTSTGIELEYPSVCGDLEIGSVFHIHYKVPIIRFWQDAYITKIN